MRPSRILALVLAALVGAGGCIVVSRGVVVSPVRFASSDSTRVRTPVKAHLADGSTIVYPAGVTVAQNALLADAWRFGPTTRDSTPISRVSLDSVVGVEVFQSHVNAGRSVAYSTLTSAAILLGGVALACATDPKCFGSCPTVYADSAGTPVLEAEGFSYSISPLLEARDVDRLRAQPDTLHRLRLQVWNEALETHYINQLELLEVRHGRAETVVPDEHNRPVAVGEWLTPATMRDRIGRDLRATLGRADGVVFSTDDRTLAAASATDMTDHIDVVVPRPPGARSTADSVAVVLRMRNSLLNTELFYEFMLAHPGARSLDWMTTDLARIDRTVELGRFYARHLGLRIELRDGAEWREVTRITDYGPIAWRDVAAVIPARTIDGDSLRIRISFLSDQWRIDRLAIAARVRRATPRTIPVTRLTGLTDESQADALEAVRAADEHYLVTTPRQRFTIEFDVGAAPADSARTFLLASQGWYAEWVRGNWMTGRRDTATFSPTDDVLLRALRQWRVERDSMQRQFYRSRIPVQ